MSKGRKWYKKEEYKKPLEPFDPGDGSIIEVVADPDTAHPEALKITRVWPDNHVTTVRVVPPSKFSNALYLSIEGDRKIEDPNAKERTQKFEESLQNGTYRPPYLQLSSIPGNKPGDTWDEATQQHLETRERFNKYYKDNNLEKVPANDSTLDKGKGAGGKYMGAAEQFDPAKPPPVPPQFQGVKFHYGGT